MRDADLPEWATIEEDVVLVAVPDSFDEAVERYQRSPLFRDAIDTTVDQMVDRKGRYTVPGFISMVRGKTIQIEVARVFGEVTADD